MSELDELLAKAGEVIGLEELQGADYNPRLISEFDFKALKTSLLTFGDLSGVVRNMATKNLVGGHQRVEAFKAAGPDAKIVITDRLEKPSRSGTLAYGYVMLQGERFSYREVAWPLDFEKAANIAANNITGEWDKDKLAKAMYEISDELRRLTGHTDNEISRLLDMVGAGTDSQGEDDAPAKDEAGPAVSREGEIYQLGPHRLMCGSSTIESDVAALMNGQTAAMAFTDPPYNIAFEGNVHADGSKSANAVHGGILNDKMSGADFTTFLEAVCANLLKFAVGGIYACMSVAELDRLKLAFVKAGGHFQNYIIWKKNNFTLSGADYQRIYEPILYGWKEGAEHFFIERRDLTNVWENANPVVGEYDGEITKIKVGDYELQIEGEVRGRIYKTKAKHDLWEIDRPIRSDLHPTMKPVALCEEAIRNSSRRGEGVLDLFGGSGSTLIAADKLERVCYMMELDPKYCDVIRKRYAAHLGREGEWQQVTPAVSTNASEGSKAALTPAA